MGLSVSRPGITLDIGSIAYDDLEFGGVKRLGLDVLVQAMGTVIGGIPLVFALKIGGLLAGVDWSQVGKAGAVVAGGGAFLFAFTAYSNRNADEELADLRANARLIVDAEGNVVRVETEDPDQDWPQKRSTG